MNNQSLIESSRMSTLERSLVLIALVIAVFALLQQRSGSSVADASFQEAGQLGPASKLLLSGETPLVVVNEQGRLGWGNQPTSRAWSMGAVHITRIIKATLMSEAYSSERKDLKEELREMDEEFSTRAEALKEEYGDIKEDNPNFPEAQTRMQAVMQEYQQFAQVAQARLNELQTQQLERAYREMVEAVEVVADDRDVDLVFRFIPTANPFETTLVEQAMLQIQLRPLLRYPESIDLTDDVMDELDLE